MRPPKIVPTYRTTNTSATGPATTPTSSFPDPLAEVSCRFFKIGKCKNGDNCRFRHDAIAEEEKAHELIPPQAGEDDSEPNSGQYSRDGPKVELTKATESNARDLGGALVRFGPGGNVPSKIATFEFTSSQSMEEAAQTLGQTKVLNRTLNCKTAVNKKAKPWQCCVKIGNLDVSTTSKMLRDACGRQPRKVTFGESSYSSSSEAIGQAVQRLLSSIGNLESWTMSSSSKSAQSKATATFSTMEQAAKAITEFNGYKLPQLGGSKILLSYLVKAKFSILSSMNSAISSELANVQRSFRSNNYLEIKCYPSANKNHRFTALHIISDTAQEVGKAKAAVERILNGHTARGGKDLI
ncbi:MAG: hypothetical protein Q9217_001165 [Psora testacea]